MATDLSQAFHNLGVNRAGAYMAQQDKINLQNLRKEMGLELASSKSSGVSSPVLTK